MLSYNFPLYQQTPMHTAAKNGNEFIRKGLIMLGADINIKDKNGVSETILLVVHIIEVIRTNNWKRKEFYK